ncbi:hypothetical protein GLOIN_2v1773272 [Rhizophagus irregularis DAOM 181602=DAOM 197198]|nr:hypothetical protein GLOIN_2v1773272 [Rhizophagus irregularis DAOM 181602=DAOM 197198]
MTKKRSLLTRHIRTLHSPLSIDASRDGQGIQTVRSLSHLNSAESIDQIHNRNRLNRSSSLDTEERIYPEKDLHSLQETAQKQYNKKHRKEIKNEIKILIRSDPRIQSLLEQRGIRATLSIVRDVFSDLHKNGRRKWKESQLNEAEIKQKKIMSHIINRLSEKRDRRMKGALAMKNHPDYQKSFKKRGIKDINEILNKNEYHSPEESDLENDPNASTDRKNLFVYKLSWRSDEYVEKYFPENKRVRPRILKDEFWKNKKAPPNLIWWTLKDGKRESPSVHKSIDEDQQSQQSYGLNVDKLDINAESDEEEEGEDEEVIDNMRDQSKKTNKKSSSKPSSQEQEHIHDNVPKRTSKEKEKEQ